MTNERPTREQLEEKIRPAAIDVVFAKQVILNDLMRTAAAETTDLIESVLRAADAPILTDRQANEASIDDQVLRCRWLAAARLALADLAGSGLALPLNAPGQSQRELTISIRTARAAWSERFNGFDLVLSPTYRLSAKASNTEQTLLVDPDLYLAAIQAPGMHQRVRASLIEAVSCYRSELYLAAAILLGTASEGTWMQLANTVVAKLGQTAPRKLAEELARPAPSMETIQQQAHNAVRSHLRDALRQADLSLGMWDGIFESATYYRTLRNFAVHLEEGVDQLDYALVGTTLARARDYFRDLHRLCVVLQPQ